MILPESYYLYRNIRKKQKMIDAFNEIKREEEENRKNLQLGIKTIDSNKKVNHLIVFNKSIQESINRYQPSQLNNLDDSKSTISISLYNKPLNNNNPNSGFVTPTESFRDDYYDTTNASIESIVNNLNKNFDILNNNLIETPKRGNSNNKNEHIEQQSALNNNRKFISHKAAVSLIPENKTININNNNNYNSNNIKSINKETINQGKSEKNKKRNLELKFDFQKNLNKSPNNERLHTISTLKVEKNKKSFKKEEETNFFNKEAKGKNSEFKSPNSKNILDQNKFSLLPKRPITTTVKTTTHYMPIYKNKNKNKNTENNNYSASINKVNSLKTKLDKKNNNSIRKHNTMKSLGNILDKKIFLSSFITKELKKSNENNKENKDSSNQNDKNVKEINMHVNTLSTNEKKYLYKNYIEKNKNNRNSYDPSNKNKINKKVNNNLSINSNAISQRKIYNLKNPSLDKQNILNLEKGSLSEMQNKIKVEKIGFENNNKLKIKEKVNEKGNNIIKKINYNHIDTNTKKMKFIKK